LSSRRVLVFLRDDCFAGCGTYDGEYVIDDPEDTFYDGIRYSVGTVVS